MRILIASLAATGLLASNASGQGANAPLCENGSSVAYMAHLYVTAGHSIDSTVTGASIVFLIECPTSLVGAFDRLAPYDTETPHRWREAVQRSARDPSDSTLRGLLTVAMQRVALAHDRALDDHTEGIFDAVRNAPKPDHRTLQAAVDGVVLAMLEEHGNCEAEVCNAISNTLVFFLGTHPVAVFKAMRADSAGARNWLQVVDDESFSGVEDFRARAEAARRAVIGKLEHTPPDGFVRERRECLATLRRIRYRAYR